MFQFSTHKKVVSGNNYAMQNTLPDTNLLCITDHGGLVVSTLSSGIQSLKKQAKPKFESCLEQFYELIVLTKQELIYAPWIPWMCVIVKHLRP